MTITLQHFLVLSAILFSLGVFTILTQRNAIRVLMGVELVLNAASLNFVALSRYGSVGLTGQVVALFIIVLAAAESAVALAIVLSIFRRMREIDVDNIDSLKG
jgi:NADH-quinone oxidoreductase subunit K